MLLPRSSLQLSERRTAPRLGLVWYVSFVSAFGDACRLDCKLVRVLASRLLAAILAAFSDPAPSE